MARKRRFFSPEEKVAILRKHLVEGVPVSEVCKEYDLAPALFYQWQRELFRNGQLAFQGNKPDPRVARLEAENQRLRQRLQKRDEALAELMQEHIKLKKELGEL